MGPATVAHEHVSTPRIPHRTVVVALLALAIALTGLGLRLQRVDTWHGTLSADEKSYLRLAYDLNANHQWGDGDLRQPFRWAPGTPVLFAAAGTLGGAPIDRDTAASAQVLVGLALIAATFALGALLAGPWVGLAAAAAVAVSPSVVRATATAATEPLGALMIVLVGLALVTAARRARPGWWLLAGLALGAATLVRGDLVPVAVLMPIAAGIVVWRGSTRRAGLTSAAAMLAGVAVLIVPWSAYASQRVHRFVPVTDGGAGNLFIGTYLPGDGRLFGVKRAFADQTRRLHPSLRHLRWYKLPQEVVLDTVASMHHRVAHGREAQLRAAARENLRRYALGRPLAFAGMEIRKLGRMWGRPYAGSRSHAGALEIAQHLALVILAVAGLLAGIVLARDRRLVLLAIFIALTTLVDVAFVSEARHNARLLPLLVIAGAAGWVLAVASRRARGSTRSAPRPAPGT